MTTLIRDYNDIKNIYPDHLLFYRLGEFYELFFEDALTASKELGITLNKKKMFGGEVESCGIPARSLPAYSGKLLKLGFKIAVAEQFIAKSMVGTDKNSNGVKKFIRKVTKILTPGTFINDDSLQSYLADEYNILLAIAFNSKEGQLELCWGDILLGEFYVDKIGVDQLTSYLQFIRPKEVLIEKEHEQQYQGSLSGRVVSFYQPSSSDSLSLLSGLENNGCVIDNKIIKILSKSNNLALQFIVDYACQIHRYIDVGAWQISYYQDHQYLKLDQNTVVNLELVASKSKESNNSLMAVINKTKTAMGRRLLKYSILKPLNNIHKINQRLKVVEFLLVRDCLQKSLICKLCFFPDLEKIMGRIVIFRKANAQDLLLILQALQSIAQIAQMLSLYNNESKLPDKLADIAQGLIYDSNLIGQLQSALEKEAIINEEKGSLIKEGFDSRMDCLREKRHNHYRKIRKLTVKYQKQSSVKNLKIEYNNILGYFIEVKSKLADKLLYLPGFDVRQNLINRVRYTSIQMQDLESEINNLNNKILALEAEILAKLVLPLLNKFDDIKGNCKFIAELDLLVSFALVAKDNNYCLPILNDKNKLQITAGRNAIIERFNDNFIANSCNLSEQERVWLISGANMAGKSTFLRQNALIVIMAHMGCFVPAQLANIAVMEQIFTRMGSNDNLAAGQSAFMCEMLEIADILNHANENSLVIIDEIGSSTSSQYGVALALGIIGYLHNSSRSLVMVSTHYQELCQLAKQFAALKNYQMVVDKDNDDYGIKFNYQIKTGIASDSFAIDVAKMTKLPDEVITAAIKLLCQNNLC